MRKHYLEARLNEYLNRRSPPQALSKNQTAMADEVAALVRAVLRCAPDRGYQEWWPKLEDNLDRSLPTRAWPTVFEINAAAPPVACTNSDRGSRSHLSASELDILENQVLPTSRRWLSIPELAEHGKQTLEYWGEESLEGAE